jgi:hypothetical protein
LYFTEFKELWCFDCLPHHDRFGPANKENKKKLLETAIIDKTRLAIQKYDYRQKLMDNNPKAVKRFCISCEKEFKTDKYDIFCGACLIYQYGHVCTKCHKLWDKDEKCDSLGRCWTCSDRKLTEFELIRGTDDNGQISFETGTFHALWRDCNNCNSFIHNPYEVVCQTCSDRLLDRKVTVNDN